MSVLTPGRNIVLIGLMGTGKTTVGKIVAQRLGRPFVDIDELVEREAHADVAEIFRLEGERGFRRRESEAVRHVAALRGQVVAAGGGVVLDPSNVTHLQATSDMVLLDGDPQVLATRVDTATRPLLAGRDDVTGRLGELRAQRWSAYTAAAGHTVDTTQRTPEQVADAVLVWAGTQPGLLARDEMPA